MRLTEMLQYKRAKIREIPKWGHFLRKEWENQFASHLTEDEKRAIYLTSKHGYLWHLFSYGKKDCKEKGEAEKEFDHQPKKSCYLFFYFILRDNDSLL